MGANETIYRQTVNGIPDFFAAPASMGTFLLVGARFASSMCRP
jgi:hypothetical protein